MEKNEISNTKINFSVEPKYLYTLSCGSTNLKLYTDEMILGSEEDIVKKLLIKTLKNVYTFDVDEKDLGIENGYMFVKTAIEEKISKKDEFKN